MTTILIAASVLLSGLQHPRQDLPIYPVRDANYWKWRDQPWTVEDLNVSENRKKLDLLADKGAGSLPQIERIAIDSMRRFESAPKPDARPLITWTYAAFRAERLEHSSWERTKGEAAKNYMERMTPIPSYEYARTRFLVISDIYPDKYAPLGKRLLKKDGNDYFVKYCFTSLMISLGNLVEAKRLSGELLREWPNKINVYSLVADIYYFASYGKTNKQDLLQAKKYYEIYLQKAPTTDGYIKTAKWRLSNVEKKLAGG